jgi:hypothetical protein
MRNAGDTVSSNKVVLEQSMAAPLFWKIDAVANSEGAETLSQKLGAVVIWNVTPCSPSIFISRFGGTSRLYRRTEQ